MKFIGVIFGPLKLQVKLSKSIVLVEFRISASPLIK